MNNQESLQEIFNLRLRFQMNSRLRLESLAALSRLFREHNEDLNDELLATMVFALPAELPGERPDFQVLTPEAKKPGTQPPQPGSPGTQPHPPQPPSPQPHPPAANRLRHNHHRPNHHRRSRHRPKRSHPEERWSRARSHGSSQKRHEARTKRTEAKRPGSARLRGKC